MRISIDIGTSYSSVCIQDAKGEAKPVETSTGISIYGSKYSLPSAVFVEDNGEVLVGQAAMNSRKKKPQNFRSEFKRDLGQDIPIVLGDRSFLPEELYTELFRHMKKCAEKSGNDTVEKAYITYPASFGKARCSKIRQAAKDAGLFDVELVDEPTAAAMCYGAKGSLKDGDVLLVYDFGGGTFDVSLLQYGKGRYEPLAPAMGMEHCGGIDIDRAIYADMVSKVDPEMLKQLSANKTYRMRFEGQLAELAVKVKHHLSNAEQAEEAIAIGLDILDYGLSRESLEGMIAGLVSQTVDCCKGILADAGMGVGDIDGILLVGGTSRVPLVQEMVRKFAGSTPVYEDVDPDLAVAMGALEQGYSRAKTARPETLGQGHTGRPEILGQGQNGQTEGLEQGQNGGNLERPVQQQPKIPVMMADEYVFNDNDSWYVGTNVLGSKWKRYEIHAITFLDSLEHKAEDAWDVSARRDRSVMAWITGKENGIRHLYIGGEGGVAAPKTCRGLFGGYPKLKEIKFNGCFDTSRVTDMGMMFRGCGELEALDVGDFNTSQVADMGMMFRGCSKLANLDVGHFDTAQAKDMNGMFAWCSKLEELDVSHFDTAQVTNMSLMFHKCSALENLDVSHFDTGRVTDMSFMFEACEKLENLDVSHFNTSQVKRMGYMFAWCKKLGSLDVSNFNTNQVSDVKKMFEGCGSLENLDLSSFDMPNIANKEGMTGYCKFDAKVSGKGSVPSNAIKEDSFGKKSSVGLSNAAKLDKVKQMCREFAGDSATYKGNAKLYATLGMQGQEVYLAHDDSWFQRGKNGFAVTEHGIYCCDFASVKTHVTFQELARANHITIRESEVYADYKQIAYLSGLNSVREELKRLFERIAVVYR